MTTTPLSSEVSISHAPQHTSINLCLKPSGRGAHGRQADPLFLSPPWAHGDLRLEPSVAARLFVLSNQGLFAPCLGEPAHYGWALNKVQSGCGDDCCAETCDAVKVFCPKLWAKIAGIAAVDFGRLVEHEHFLFCLGQVQLVLEADGQPGMAAAIAAVRTKIIELKCSTAEVRTSMLAEGLSGEQLLNFAAHHASALSYACLTALAERLWQENEIDHAAFYFILDWRTRTPMPCYMTGPVDERKGCRANMSFTSWAFYNARLDSGKDTKPTIKYLVAGAAVSTSKTFFSPGTIHPDYLRLVRWCQDEARQEAWWDLMADEARDRRNWFEVRERYWADYWWAADMLLLARPHHDSANRRVSDDTCQYYARDPQPWAYPDGSWSPAFWAIVENAKLPGLVGSYVTYGLNPARRQVLAHITKYHLGRGHRRSALTEAGL